MITCPNCKAQNVEGSLFCGECGQSFNPIQSRQNPITLSDIESSRFFTFSEPFLKKIDGGQLFKSPFQWIYVTFAILNLLIPLVILYLFIEGNIFKYGGFASVIMFLFITFAFWIGFQLLWDRKSRVNDYISKGDEFLAIPVFSHFIQTLGEWYGVILGICSIGIGFTSLFSSEGLYYFRNFWGFPLGEFGGWIIILGPIFAFFIIVFTRCIAEGLRALASIANNTKRTKNFT